MEKHYLRSVWFADEKRIRSMTKVRAFNEKGSLRIETNLLYFRGKKTKISIAKIRKISITRQRLSWISMLIVNVLVGACLAALKFQLPPGFMPTQFVVFSILILLYFNAFAILVSYNTKWIRIEYGNEPDPARLVYFADGSWLGWGGILGGTRKIYQELSVRE